MCKEYMDSNVPSIILDCNINLHTKKMKPKKFLLNDNQL